MINPDWDRWILASVSEYFKDALAGSGLLFFVEGQEYDKNDARQKAELAIEGPLYEEQSAKQWKVSINLNILLSLIKDQKDFHKSHKMAGLVASKFTNSIN